MLMKKICRRAKNRESRRRQRQLGATEKREKGKGRWGGEGEKREGEKKRRGERKCKEAKVK